MKFSYAAIVAISASFTSAAYTAADIPSCAISCFETGAPQVGCTVTDQTCQCAKASELTDKITGCVTDACSVEDALKTQQVSNGICEQLSSSASSAAATSTASASASEGSSSVPITSSISGISAPSNNTTSAMITTPLPSSNATALMTSSSAAASSTTTSTKSSTKTASSTKTETADSDSSSTNSASGTASAASSSSTANAGSVDRLGENFGLAVAIGLGCLIAAI
ncbi:hypothetical protein BFW01_g2971 [Lasiodiplodia theobromae]|uniref:CFEM domain-containing protein n=1 Tax=Lasiodiplodia theobromae TaxID=45133 RepID=A0A5N5CU45_9PEZI|nr:Cfem domain-containing protein [Lasiodiplodia theobromae]KAB2568877.1 hypothetical protein DBV05_g12444 [Lasiodiplodia theobromae]KAF4546701.1 Cfem domain-containing protein [Lasiodiplodia theobromae]KAF9632109.1 hypothetical protein BFW01_g2971 [Lasiodiplodia theobromae]